MINRNTIVEIIERAVREKWTTLSLCDLGLDEVPPEICELTLLEYLDLSSSKFSTQYKNRLETLPDEIGCLSNLKELDLSNNEFEVLPSVIGLLPRLENLIVDDNDIISPPPEIIAQGTQAILTFLRERLPGSQRRWTSKMILVGEGGVGKTSILRALKNLPFDSQLSTTHGINVDYIDLQHPERTQNEITMRLSIWDFGGQEIYHATHQFFLTNRSLFLLVWNARLGYEQGKLYYWLDSIQAKAPESPIILVATHIDERDPSLPLTELKTRYPSLKSQIAISNKNGIGITTLKNAIATEASKLPLMGEIWPKNWLDFTENLRLLTKRHISMCELNSLGKRFNLSEESTRILLQWLHELGELLHFQNDEYLNDLVILKPQWVTDYISKVLDSDDVIIKNGIFTNDHMKELWNDLEPYIQKHLLGLMEKFDLSYRTLENREISLVVERLPHDSPRYQSQWELLQTDPSNKTITMIFKLNTIPPGIPTWFIARSHRFTTHTHWLTGALFAHRLTDNEPHHFALILAFPHERYLQLTVIGPNPANFFTLMRDGLELTLARYPGLKIERFMPCPGHDGHSCHHEFRYEQLEKRLEYNPPRYFIECPEELVDIDVRELLFGLTPSTLDRALEEIELKEENSKKRHTEVIALVQREFTKIYRREQSIIDTYCPNIFVLRPHGNSSWKDILIGNKIELQLYCQQPGCWHPAGEPYLINQPVEWLRRFAPYLQGMIRLLKIVTPFIGPWVGISDEAYKELVENDIKLMETLVDVIPEIMSEKEQSLWNQVDLVGQKKFPNRITGASLRAFRQLLEQVDPKQYWSGLHLVLTPEGHYLWLCDFHSQGYLE